MRSWVRVWIGHRVPRLRAPHPGSRQGFMLAPSPGHAPCLRHRRLVVGPRSSDRHARGAWLGRVRPVRRYPQDAGATNPVALVALHWWQFPLGWSGGGVVPPLHPYRNRWQWHLGTQTSASPLGLRAAHALKGVRLLVLSRRWCISERCIEGVQSGASLRCMHQMHQVHGGCMHLVQHHATGHSLTSASRAPDCCSRASREWAVS